MTHVTEPMKDGWEEENPRGNFRQKYAENLRTCHLQKLTKPNTLLSN